MTEKLALGAIAPHYSGAVFTTGIEALTLIRDYLVSESWQIVTDDINNTNTLLMRGATDNNHYCWIKFSLIINVSDRQLVIQGDLDGTDNILSPPLSFKYDYGANNKLYLVADADSAGICIRDRYTYAGGVSFGFLERFDSTDEFAWMVAKTNNQLTDAYIARGKHNNDPWHQIGSSYANTDLFFLTDYNGPYQGVTDFLTALSYGSNIDLTILNAGYYAHRGAVNGVNNFGLLTRRFYVEGTGNPNSYLPNVNRTGGIFYNRGYVKHFVNGLAGLAGGAFFPDERGSIYFSTGSDRELGWQGMVIKSVSSEEERENPDSSRAVYHGGETGVEFSDRDIFFTEFKNVLTTIGWEVESDDIDSVNQNREVVFKGRYRQQEEYCYLVCLHQSNINTLKVKGRVVESDTESYDSPEFEFNFSGDTNRFWLSASSQALALNIESEVDSGADTLFKGIYFGYYSDRLDPEDKYAWGIGAIANDLNQFYVAKSYFDDVYWQQIGADFEYSTTERSSYPAYGTSDRLTISLVPKDYYDNELEDGTNSGLYAHLGGINQATGLSQLDFFAVIEGRKQRGYGAESFGQQKPKQLFYRGYIEFVCVGTGGRDRGAIMSAGDAKFRRVGGNTWQGIQIG